MKTTLIKILAILSLGLLLSCEEYLDVSPDMGITEEVVYSDYVSFSGAVNRGIGLLHNYVYDPQGDNNEVGTYSDEAQDLGTARSSVGINKGIWLAAKNEKWGPSDFGMYEGSEFDGRHYHREPAGEGMLGIRAMNLCLENYALLEKFPEEAQYSEEELRNQLLGQCYFLRGWFYFNIIMRYGGMPIMDESYSTTADFDLVRPTYLVSNEFVIANMDSALKYLPADWSKTASTDLGRPTITTALAVKAQAYLFAASPNMNPDLNTDFDDPNPVYNDTIAKKGIKAYAAALESALDPSTRYEMKSWADYSKNWLNETEAISNEAIFQPFIAKRNAAFGDAGLGWFLPGFDGGWGTAFSAPTQNAVDWFETIDGYAIEDAPAASFNPQDPYSNRDPRLKNAIYCHGDRMYLDDQKAIQGKVSATLEADAPDGYHFENLVTLQSGIWTGYLHGGMRDYPEGGVGGKHRSPGWNKFDQSASKVRIFPFIRFAQLYLDYAELVNEVYGPTKAPPEAANFPLVANMTALEAVMKVRTRAGMGDVKAEYLTSSMAFRARIYNERAVEFFNEFKRWHDLRRWRIAKPVLAKGIWAADISENKGVYTYSKKKLEGSYRVFENKHYWYPFPQEVINMMLTFEQNPGW